MSSPFLVTHDGLRLFTRRWLPEGPARAAFVLIHGYGDHSGRYSHVADTVAQIGGATYAFDLRGHGQSEGRRAYVDYFEQYLDDLGQFVESVRGECPDRPLILFGHSMGGLIALKYALDRDPEVHGLVLSSPAIEVNPDLAPFLRRVSHIIGRVAPTLPTVRSPEGAISRDPAVVAEAEADPLNYHGRLPARTGAELLRAGTSVQHRLDAVTTPFLVLHGTADILTSPDWSKRLYERAASTDKTIKLYDGLYHETFNEPEKDEVLQDLGDWLAARCP